MAAELTAEVLLDACDHARTLDRSAFDSLTDLARAEALQTGIAVARLARGERPVGYKIGFTNRAIWPLYGVFHPIWGPVWNSTLVRACAGPDGVPPPIDVDCARFAQPRIEPEIVVGLRAKPEHDTPEAVLAAADWIAHGIEIVQCPFPGWRFSAAEAIAAQAMHAMLIVGPRKPLAAFGSDAASTLARIAEIELDLYCDDTLVERGRASNALDGPMDAIAHLTREMRLRGHSIEAGSLVTTGTVTDAQPLHAGQCWRTRVSGDEFPGLELRVH